MLIYVCIIYKKEFLFFPSSLGWFGLRRDLCEIILDYCPFISLYFNNQFKYSSRSTTNDLPTEKHLEPLFMNTLTSIDMNSEKNLTKQYHFLSLLEPD